MGTDYNTKTSTESYLASHEKCLVVTKHTTFHSSLDLHDKVRNEEIYRMTYLT